MCVYLHITCPVLHYYEVGVLSDLFAAVSPMPQEYPPYEGIHEYINDLDSILPL